MPSLITHELLVVNNAALHHLIPPILNQIAKLPDQKNINFNCSRIDTASTPALFNGLLTISLYFLQALAGIIPLQQVVSIIRNSNFDAKLVSTVMYSINRCDRIRGTIVCSTGNENQVKNLIRPPSYIFYLKVKYCSVYLMSYF